MKHTISFYLKCFICNVLPSSMVARTMTMHNANHEPRSPAQSTGRAGRCPASARQAHSISGGAESLVCSSEQLSRTRVRVTWHVRAVPWPGYLGGNYIPIMTDCSSCNIVTSIVDSNTSPGPVTGALRMFTGRCR